MGIYLRGLCLGMPSHGFKVGWNVCATIERSGFDSRRVRLSVCNGIHDLVLLVI
jgi:hypothetical protein